MRAKSFTIATLVLLAGLLLWAGPASAACKGRTIRGTPKADVLTGTCGPDRILGLGGNDKINGGAGNDKLDGGRGVDAMLGGIGNDIYFVNQTTGEATEFAGEGTDRVNASSSYTLGANLENLTLLGAGNTSGTGNTADNIIIGNSGANILNGHQGNDTLTGKGGADKFDFTKALVAGNVDTITDFAVGVDSIRVDNAVFTGLAAGALPSSQFHIGTAAADGNDHIIYNSANGNLFFDIDGIGSTAQVRFAVLDPGLALTAGDFFVI